MKDFVTTLIQEFPKDQLQEMLGTSLPETLNQISDAIFAHIPTVDFSLHGIKTAILTPTDTYLNSLFELAGLNEDDISNLTKLVDGIPDPITFTQQPKDATAKFVIEGLKTRMKDYLKQRAQKLIGNFTGNQATVATKAAAKTAAKTFVVHSVFTLIVWFIVCLNAALLVGSIAYWVDNMPDLSEKARIWFGNQIWAEGAAPLSTQWRQLIQACPEQVGDLTKTAKEGCESNEDQCVNYNKLNMLDTLKEKGCNLDGDVDASKCCA